MIGYTRQEYQDWMAMALDCDRAQAARGGSWCVQGHVTTGYCCYEDCPKRLGRG